MTWTTNPSAQKLAMAKVDHIQPRRFGSSHHRVVHRRWRTTAPRRAVGSSCSRRSPHVARHSGRVRLPCTAAGRTFRVLPR